VKHFNQYFLCLHWWFSRPFKKKIHFPFSIINFFDSLKLLKLLTNFESCLLKPFSSFHSLWLVDVLQCRPLISWTENVKELTCKGGFRYDFTKSRQLPVCIFSVKVAALGLYWKNFHSELVISREQKHWVWFHQQRNKKMSKPSMHVQ
jgi:hypothetical protein